MVAGTTRRSGDLRAGLGDLGERDAVDEGVVGRRGAAGVVDRQRGRGVALRVEVDDQHPQPALGQRDGEVDRGRGLADPALLVGDHHDAGARRPRQRLPPQQSRAEQQGLLDGVGQRRVLGRGRHRARSPVQTPGGRRGQRPVDGPADVVSRETTPRPVSGGHFPYRGENPVDNSASQGRSRDRTCCGGQPRRDTALFREKNGHPRPPETLSGSWDRRPDKTGSFSDEDDVDEAAVRASPTGSCALFLRPGPDPNVGVGPASTRTTVVGKDSEFDPMWTTSGSRPPSRRRVAPAAASSSAARRPLHREDDAARAGERQRPGEQPLERGHRARGDHVERPVPVQLLGPAAHHLDLVGQPELRRPPRRGSAYAAAAARAASPAGRGGGSRGPGRAGRHRCRRRRPWRPSGTRSVDDRAVEEVPLPEPRDLTRTEQAALGARAGQQVGVLLGQGEARSEHPRRLRGRRGCFT